MERKQVVLVVLEDSAKEQYGHAGKPIYKAFSMTDILVVCK
jgi:hypothetical protein